MATLEKTTSPDLLLSMMLHGREYPFGQFGSDVLAVPPFSLLPISSLLTVGGRVSDLVTERLNPMQELFSNS